MRCASRCSVIRRINGAASAKSSSDVLRGSVRTCGHHQQPHRAAAGGRRQAPGPGDLDGGFQRQPLEIACGDGPLPGAQGQRAAHLCLLDGFRVHPAGGRPQVDAAGDVRHRTAQHGQRPGADVAGRAAAVPVTGNRDLRAVPGDAAVLAHRPVRVADPRAEPDHAGGRVPDEMGVVRTRSGRSPPPRSIPPSRSDRSPGPSRRAAAGSTGGKVTRNSCPGLPSDRPSTSAGEPEACSARTVAPIVATRRSSIVGVA